MPTDDYELGYEAGYRSAAQKILQLKEGNRRLLERIKQLEEKETN